MTEAPGIYLDNNASTPLVAEVRQALEKVLTESYANPSSAHGAGQAVRGLITAARENVATLVGAQPEQVVFTSGGTEGNNAVIGHLRAGGIRRIVTSAVEHPSITNPLSVLERSGVDVVVLPVDSHGVVDMADLEAALAVPAGVAVTIQWANSETGVLQPIHEIAEVCQERGVLLHVDAAQAIGRVPIDCAQLGVDFLTFSGHKIHAPKGVGALYVRHPRQFTPAIMGGAQEWGLRAGTENVLGIVGMGVACSIRYANFSSDINHMFELRREFEDRLLVAVPEVIINGAKGDRVCNTSNIRVPNIDGAALVAQLDRVGIVASQTSACSSAKPEPSRVLMAMGLTEDEAFSSLRFSVSVQNTRSEIAQAVDAIVESVQRLRNFSRLMG